MFLRAGRALFPSFFHRRACLSLCAALLSALCCGGVARAQSGNEDTGTGGRHTIQGRVVFPSGRRADTRLKVRLQSSQSGELSVYTDSNGAFSFRSLEAGSYTVIIEGGDDFETTRESIYIEPDINSMVRGVTGPPVSRPYTLQVYLQPKRRDGDDDAEREFQQAVKLGGDPAGRAHYYLGGIYWSRREYKKAAEELELYLKQSPKAPDAEQTRATIEKLRGRS